MTSIVRQINHFAISSAENDWGRLAFDSAYLDCADSCLQRSAFGLNLDEYNDRDHEERDEPATPRIPLPLLRISHFSPEGHLLYEFSSLGWRRQIRGVVYD